MASICSIIDLWLLVIIKFHLIFHFQYDVGGNAAIMGLKMIYSNKNSTVRNAVLNCSQQVYLRGLLLSPFNYLRFRIEVV